MDEAKEIRKILRYLEHQEIDLAPEITKTPIESYTNPERFEQEQRLLFRSYPLVLGHSSRLSEPKSFFTDEIANVPILCTWPSKGEPRAFINACRHRGTKLVCEASGRDCEAFVCPYHAWTYHSDGRLLGISHEKTFGKIERSDAGLAPLSLVSRFGLLWLCVEGQATVDISEPLAAELRWLDMESHVVFQPYKRRWNFNWKLGIDGGLESYHFRYAHAKSIYPLFFDNLLSYEDYAPNARLTLPKRTIKTLPPEPDEHWKIREHANLLYFIFPNVFLLVQADYIALIRMTPISPKESDIEITMLLPEAPNTEKATRHWEKNRALMIDALEEDFTLGERIQATLYSGANTHLTFGRNELGLTRFHQEINQRLSEKPRSAI
jgi:phenylpropionate dioxygenase-like ring-hydroxylating dioxygenase large terminal subunit